ncbi:MAG: DUF5336 domain-containing protein [Mycobacterium sp.]|jgi:hypothetical protein
MTFPPNNPGYPAPQQPGGYGPAPAYPVAPAGPAVNRLPSLLAGAVVALGLAAYLASFGPLLKINADIGPFGGASFTASGLSYWTIAALTASLLAAVSLLPKSKLYTPIVAVAAVLGVLLVIGQIVNRPNGFSIGWALWAVLLFTVFQAVAAVTALLFESGVLAAPVPRPRYEQYGQYGPPPGGYFSQQGGQPGPQGQRPGYPAPYGNYPTGGFPGQEADSPPTPPTGIPSFTPPPGQPSTQPSTESAQGPTQGPGSGSAPS